MEMPGELARQICRHDKSSMALQICRPEYKRLIFFFGNLMEMPCVLACQICRHDSSTMDLERNFLNNNIY